MTKRSKTKRRAGRTRQMASRCVAKAVRIQEGVYGDGSRRDDDAWVADLLSAAAKLLRGQRLSAVEREEVKCL